jgi:hypothetical protein
LATFHGAHPGRRGPRNEGVEDSGNANPEDDFRYDATLGGSGGYIFNKSTKGLSAGTWTLRLSIDSDSQSGYQLLFDVR